MEIIAKKVSMMELFYDLIYVFAVGKITEMIHHPHNGVIDMITYIKFCAGCIIILTLWFQQTIYIVNCNIKCDIFLKYLIINFV